MHGHYTLREYKRQGAKATLFLRNRHVHPCACDVYVMIYDMHVDPP